MKRKFLIVLLVLTLAIVSAFAIAACGETEKPDGGNGDNGNSTKNNAVSGRKRLIIC